jgi:hypothetical protein
LRDSAELKRGGGEIEGDRERLPARKQANLRQRSKERARRRRRRRRRSV